MNAPKKTEKGAAPKLARVARYNQHNEGDEVKYVQEFRTVRETKKIVVEAEVGLFEMPQEAMDLMDFDL